MDRIIRDLKLCKVTGEYSKEYKFLCEQLDEATDKLIWYVFYGGIVEFKSDLIRFNYYPKEVNYMPHFLIQEINCKLFNDIVRVFKVNESIDILHDYVIPYLVVFFFTKTELFKNYDKYEIKGG